VANFLKGDIVRTGPTLVVSLFLGKPPYRARGRLSKKVRYAYGYVDAEWYN